MKEMLLPTWKPQFVGLTVQVRASFIGICDRPDQFQGYKRDISKTGGFGRAKEDKQATGGVSTKAEKNGIFDNNEYKVIMTPEGRSILITIDRI